MRRVFPIVPATRSVSAMTAAIDHLVYAVPDLDSAVEELDERLGVRPAGGGRHDGWGTRNALLDVDGGTYLEVIGPDPSQPDPDGPRLFGVDDLVEPRLVAWAARTTEIDATAEHARQTGFDPGPSAAGSRIRPDGVVLSWRLTVPPATGVTVLPFLIDWGDSPHPSVHAPKGVVLEGLAAEHPDPVGTAAKLAAIGVDIAVTPGPQPLLLARLRTSDGRLVELS